MLTIVCMPVLVQAAADASLFGPKKYVRSQGKPATRTSTFTACPTATSATLKLTNGSGKSSRVSSALVVLNGVTVVAERDLNKNVPSLARTVNLKPGVNTIFVTIKSGPGSSKGDDESVDDDHDDDDSDPSAVALVIEITGKACGSSDAIPPVISNPVPSDGTLLATARPAISALFTDNSGGSGIDTTSVRVTLDGGDITGSCGISATGLACIPTGDLNNGMHSVTVTLADLAKNQASYSWRFTIDTTPPQVAVTSPLNGQHLGNPLVTVNGTVDDPAAIITVNGVQAILSGLTFSAAGIPLTEGVNTISITARDSLGNQTITPLNVTLDTSLPVVTLSAPVDGSFTNIPTVTISGQVSEAASSVMVNGKGATLTGNSFTLENLTLAEGQNTLNVMAVDLAGNKGTAIATVILDTVTPQIFVTAPADGLLTRNPQLTVSGTVSEPLASLTVNGQPVTVDAVAFTTTLTLSEGANSIVLNATDRAGNKGTATLSIILDSTPPAMPVLETLASPTNNPLVTVKGSAEPGSNVTLSAAGVQVATATADSSGLFSFSNISLTEGETLFTALSTDNAGNSGQQSAPLVVILDTLAPSAAISVPLDGTNLSTPTITVSGSIDDPTAQVTVNGLPALNSGGIWTLDGLTLQEGSNTLLVEARDPAGNKGSTSVTVILDTILPVVAITAPLDGLYTNITQVTVTGTVNEAVASVTVNGTSATLSAGSTPAANTTYTATLTLVEGGNIIVVTAVDNAGNTGTATVSVTLDTIAPQLTVIGPADGALLNNGQITFGGSAGEPVKQVTVNGIAAQAGSNGGYTLPVTLAEGNNSLIVTATDRAGNRSTSTINVTLDSIAPAAPQLDPLATPTRIATTTVSGQAEANSTVKLFNNSVLIATLKADVAGLFSVANVTLTEGSNPFTAQATDTAGNTSPLSAPLTVVLDTKAPVITVTAPQAGVIVNTAQVTIKGTVDESLTSLTVNGTSTPLSNLAFEYVMTLAAGDNSALITATDLAGNVATTTITIQRDSTPPKVTISAPLNGLLTSNPQIQVSGTVDDAEATLTVGGSAVTVTNKAFSVGYVLSDGDNTIQAKAVDKAGNEGTAAVTVTLDAQAPVVTLNAPATATAGTDVQIAVNATDNRGLTLVDVSADGASLWSATPNAATASQSVSLRLSPTLTPGATVTVRGRALDAAGNSGSATAVITIDKSADGPGWLQGKVLDDNRGLPLAGAQVSVTDAKGVQQNITTPADGAWFFELSSGAATVEVTKSGFTTVRRDVTVRPGQRTSVLDSRLTRIDGTAHSVDATGGVVKSTPFKIQNSSITIDVKIPANALSTQADARLTPVSNQGLITPLPLGWSPLAVADLRLLDPVTAAAIDPQPLTAPVTLALPLPAGLGDSALTAELARYDSGSRRWLAVAEVAVAAKATSAAAQITQPGQYALLLADPAPLNPPAPAAGQELAAVTLQPSDFSLISTSGRVVPQAAPPSVGLRAAGDLLLVAKPDAATAPALISGLVVNARVSEKFDLTGGSTLQPAATVQDIVLYRTPCATSIAGGATEPPFDSAQGPALRTTFPVAPSRDFTIVDLLLGKITVEITQPDTSGGVMVGADGARLLQPDGTSLSIPAGALTGAVPVTVATLPEVTVSSLVGADFRLLRAVDIAIAGQTLKSSATLSIPAPTGFDPALPVVVAKKFDVKGGSKLKLVAAARLSGSIINSEALAPELTSSSNSINSSGQYLFLQAVAPIGYVAGQITDAAAAAFAGIHVSAQSATLADLTGVNGQYLLALAAGSQTVTALDPARGDAASVTVAIAANTKSTLNLTVAMIPPTVVSISPANGAANVQPTVPVVVSFSKPMDKNSINSQTLKLTNSSNSEAVPGVLTFNVDNTAVTFYPSDAFKQETPYSVTVAATVKDLQGYQLGQNVVSSFTVRRITPPVMPAAGAVSGTFPDAEGYITVTGSQGSAETGNTVLLINDTTGEIQSVTPQSNGSFTGKVRAQLGDEIKVVLMDYSGNQTTISYLTFKGPDGSYLVTAKGGKIEGDGGSLLDIPEGALVGPTVIKLTTIQEANLPSPLQSPGKYLGAVNIDTGGIRFQKKVDVSIPLPDGFDPNTSVFVTRPSTLYNTDGTIEQVYEVIDTTKVVGNRVTTACWPFDGIMEFGSFVFTSLVPNTDVGIVSGYAYQDMNDNNTFDAMVDKPVRGAVIRNSTAWNYVSYARANGFYSSFTTLTGAGNTTNPGYLISLDLTEPSFPMLMNASQPNSQSVQRISVAIDYSYNGTGNTTGTVDLAIAGTREGKISTLDVTDPYSPSLIGTVTDQKGTDLIRIVRDIAINKNSGLAFAVTFDAVLVIDIKNPYNPKLLNEIKVIPGTTTPIGSNMSLAQRDGWLYLASDQNGLRTMDFYTPAQNAKEAVITVDSVNNLFVDKDGKTLNDLKVKYTINPPGYQAQSATVILVENNNGIKTQSGATTGTGTAVFPKGMLLKKDAKYEVYVVINCNTPDEKKSEKRVVSVVSVPKIEIRDKNNPCNKVPGRPIKEIASGSYNTNMLILSVDSKNEATIELSSPSSPNDPLGKEIVWGISGAPNKAIPQKGSLESMLPAITITSDSDPIISYDNYHVKIGIDSNNSGQYEEGDTVIAEYDIKLIRNVYNRELAILAGGAFAALIPGSNLTNTNLSLFLNESSITYRYFDTPSPSSMILDMSDPFSGGRLTHIAGAKFEIDNSCKAQIPLYVFEATSDYSHYVAKADRIKDFIKSNIRTSRILDRYSTDGSKVIDDYYEELIGQPGNSNKEYGLSFSGPNDYHYGIGGSTIKNVVMTTYTYKTMGRVCVSKVAFKGEIDDLYDFNLFASPPADGAARIQFGYNGDDRKSGQIYWYTIKLDEEITLDSPTNMPFGLYCLN